MNEFEGQVNFVFRDFPVTEPAYSIRAAQVAQCALDQSMDDFWALHDGLYTEVEIGTETDELISYAGSIGLDEAALRACVDAGTHVETVNYDQTRAETLGLAGTPSFVIGELRSYSPGEDGLREAIEQALDS